MSDETRPVFVRSAETFIVLGRLEDAYEESVGLESNAGDVILLASDPAPVELVGFVRAVDGGARDSVNSRSFADFLGKDPADAYGMVRSRPIQFQRSLPGARAVRYVFAWRGSIGAVDEQEVARAFEHNLPDMLGALENRDQRAAASSISEVVYLLSEGRRRIARRQRASRVLVTSYLAVLAIAITLLPWLLSR